MVSRVMDPTYILKIDDLTKGFRKKGGVYGRLSITSAASASEKAFKVVVRTLPALPTPSKTAIAVSSLEPSIIVIPSYSPKV